MGFLVPERREQMSSVFFKTTIGLNEDVAESVWSFVKKRSFSTIKLFSLSAAEPVTITILYNQTFIFFNKVSKVTIGITV